ncbi:hypothetical protein J7I98_11900 [Streptomyces sp. ISL-98]|uniref:hypothetical protein n=1 Tax=Streptomyces sp. ISL-98 TaxID=2819192 RepID=UPI001BE4F77C|nr:hypothetical protein [Streptomyces sp. ISL-98]MBT2506586.1 hypothetical protein [Streptomyces sp. ISL-98]
MRKFQRAAIVAAAVAGLSTLGAGVSFANDGYDGGVTAIASSQANAVANSGGPHGHPHGGPHGAPWFAPQNGVSFTPEDGHGGPHGHGGPEGH